MFKWLWSEIYVKLVCQLIDYLSITRMSIVLHLLSLDAQFDVW